MLFATSPTSQFTTHRGQNDGTGPSNILWGNAFGERLTADGSKRMTRVEHDFDMFSGYAPAISGLVNGRADGFEYYVDTATSACSIKATTDRGGVCRILTGATDNHEAWMQAGGAPFAISDTAANAQKLVFEARVRFTQVTDTYNAFIGLAEEALAAANTVTDAGAMADKDFVGFVVAEGDGDSLTFQYNKDGGSDQTVLTYGTALAAGTWYKLGFVYDPGAAPEERIAVYIDSVRQSSYVTATNIAAATFPDGEAMSPLMGVKNGAAATKSIDIDWVYCMQKVNT